MRADADIADSGWDDPGSKGSTPKPRQRRSRPRHSALSWLVVVLLAALISILLRDFVVQTFFVPSASMEPTLQIGDRILVQKIGFSLQRGDIVVFHHPAGDTEPPLNEDLVKRIIGLPGETIWSKGNTVYIDGKPLFEPWLPPNTTLGQPISRQRIPAGEYFMMGDNRSDSYDSRDWGPIPASTIIGRVFLVVWRGGRPAFHVI
jgi:signal peptidase I